MTTKTDEQERAELLPCPFCGGDHLKLFGESAPEWWVCCETCKAATQTRTNKSQAIEDWNRRAALQSQDREDAERYRAWRKAVASQNGNFLRLVSNELPDWDEGAVDEEKIDAAIDHARRVEGGGE